MGPQKERSDFEEPKRAAHRRAVAEPQKERSDFKEPKRAAYRRAVAGPLKERSDFKEPKRAAYRRAVAEPLKERSDFKEPKRAAYRRAVAERFSPCRARMDLIPAIINRKAGTAAQAAAALNDAGGFEIHEVDPEEIRRTAKDLVARKPKRILVCGGDGTVCTVAHVLANTGIELALVPGGTLNHLAKYLGLPEDLGEAARLARAGVTRQLDAGRINDRLFLNTSSVGAYEIFVRRRDRLEKRWGYAIASIVAGLQILLRTPVFAIRVEVDGVEQIYRTPLVFVGVGERELRIPSLGGRMDRGKRGLHLMIVRHRTGARLASLALQAAARGVDAVARTPAMDSLIVTKCTVELRNDTASIDGELIQVDPPLEYEFMPDALTVVIGERRGEERMG